MTKTNTIDISVALCTYKRPALLKDCLESLLDQSFEGRYEIVVIDNDRHRSAKTVVDAFAEKAAELGIPVHFDVEPEQNIAKARNAGVALCSGRYVAFIDDDETAAPDWLEKLLAAMTEFNADAILGPALPLFPDDFPEWLRKSRIYKLPKPSQHGQKITKGGATNNALLKREILEKREGPFDPAYGRTGGSDSDLYEWLIARGCTFCWSNEAKVYETQEGCRSTLSWHLRRAYRIGWRRSSALHRKYGKPWGVAKCLLREISEPFNVLSTFFRDIRNPRGAALHSARKAASALGRLGYWLGIRLEEYKIKRT